MDKDDTKLETGSQSKSEGQSKRAVAASTGATPKLSVAQLISFGERVTYTFAYGAEVASIHFDKGRGEIFYKGHNIRNMDLEEWQMQMMDKLRKILETDTQGKRFAAEYSRTLDKILLEKKNHPSE